MTALTLRAFLSTVNAGQPHRCSRVLGLHPGWYLRHLQPRMRYRCLGEGEIANRNGTKSRVALSNVSRRANCKCVGIYVGGWFYDVHPLSACMFYADCTVESSHSHVNSQPLQAESDVRRALLNHSEYPRSDVALHVGVENHDDGWHYHRFDL